MIENTADDIDESGWDHASGYGRIDAKNAVEIYPSTATLPATGNTVIIQCVDTTMYQSYPNVYISLVKKDGKGSNYYIKTQDYYGFVAGVLPHIEPGDYEMYIYGPDPMDFDSPNFREEETFTIATDVSLNPSQDNYMIPIVFDSTFKLDLDLDAAITGGATLIAEDINNLSLPSYMATSTYNYSIGEEATHVSFDLSNLSGQFRLMVYRDVVKDSSPITISGTATINGHDVPVVGVIPEGQSKGFVEDVRFIEYVDPGLIPWTIF
ncbi:hypothetical protein [Marinitoga lauensis]|uniref:hypothetical protein n=1 Tax=Marinitoga lauensis TaxID=2201189 RepID=UPI0010112F4E|nr:hypothetical protein [Marinitoga lauensis]